MSDARVRELERAFRASGAWMDWLAWAREARCFGDGDAWRLRKLVARVERDIRRGMRLARRPAEDAWTNQRVRELGRRVDARIVMDLAAAARVVGRLERRGLLPPADFLSEAVSRIRGGRHAARDERTRGRKERRRRLREEEGQAAARRREDERRAREAQRPPRASRTGPARSSSDPELDEILRSLEDRPATTTCLSCGGGMVASEDTRLCRACRTMANRGERLAERPAGLKTLARQLERLRGLGLSIKALAGVTGVSAGQLAAFLRGDSDLSPGSEARARAGLRAHRRREREDAGFPS